MDEDKQVGRTYQVDVTLVDLIRNVEKRSKDESVPIDDKHFDIILTVGGVLVGGELVSADQWFEEQSSSEEAEGSESQATKIIDAHSEDAGAPVSKDVADEDDERRYIHLRNAKFYQSGKVMPNEGIGFYWRGRLTAVDGFMLGKFEPVTRKQEPRTIDINGTRIRIE